MGKSNAQAGIDKITLSYLNLQTPKENRRNVITFVLLFLDFFGIFPLLAEPFSFEFLLAAVIPTALLHIWAIIYIVDPYRFELSYYLFFGIYGIVNTYVLFLVIQKFLYYHLRVSSKFPFIFGIVLFLGLLLFMNGVNYKALHSGTYYKLQNKKAGNTTWIVTASGIGYVVAQMIITFIFSESIKMIIILFLYSLLTVLTAYFSTSIHRYIFLRKNRAALKKVYPHFGLPKNQRNLRVKKRKK
ncbi:hypothetical protein [Sporosarcina sp. JAI121]|uniref:hypothetical protein n=1 Tax=Sporosarcina sp. JAI121 TaxID=2723064 RepID=UPI0015CAC564|nr:hypothetical protein [Sporosarcina sp. JAI121]NYF23609.1 hypothetical protein [Sporosarcina sp. JAI121]